LKFRLGTQRIEAGIHSERRGYPLARVESLLVPLQCRIVIIQRALQHDKGKRADTALHRQNRVQRLEQFLGLVPPSVKMNGRKLPV